MKVLTDSDGGKIIQTPQTATVTDLGKSPDPPDQKRIDNDKTRIQPQEITTYRVNALLLGYRLEADEDFHLVLADPGDATKTMIAELPAPNCVQDSAFAKQLQNMRNALVQRFGAPGQRTKRLPRPVPITLRGVGFFDVRHPTPQDGVAPNGFELHPVLGMALGGQTSDSTGANPGKTPRPRRRRKASSPPGGASR